MANLKVFNLDNQETGDVELHDSIAAAPYHPYIVKDTVVAYLASLQQGTHKAKGRSEIVGSGKKLYKQKGSGHARAGSAKSPIRRHGGVAFGPVPRSHAVSVNKKVRKKALASVIGAKIKNDELKVVEDLKLPDHKTKNLVKLLQGMELDKTLIVYSEEDKNFELAARNLKWVKSVHSSGLNAYDILNHKHLILTKDALQDIEGRLLK